MFTNGKRTFDGLEPACPVDNFTTYMLLTILKDILRFDSAIWCGRLLKTCDLSELNEKVR